MPDTDLPALAGTALYRRLRVQRAAEVISTSGRPMSRWAVYEYVPYLDHQLVWRWKLNRQLTEALHFDDARKKWAHLTWTTEKAGLAGRRLTDEECIDRDRVEEGLEPFHPLDRLEAPNHAG